ncbi:MAG: hypothetical protein C4K48_12895 [Candidatus Thorarchaeota archaeon]|nr:MAG: hypothetical protein C4K48_12895 [Candidatus Thorarchaeota archaeon]
MKNEKGGSTANSRGKFPDYQTPPIYTSLCQEIQFLGTAESAPITFLMHDVSHERRHSCGMASCDARTLWSMYTSPALNAILNSMKHRDSWCMILSSCNLRIRALGAEMLMEISDGGNIE